MRGFLRVAAKDLRELTSGTRSIVLFLLPLLALTLVGQLRVHHPPVRVLLEDVATCTNEDRETKPQCRLRFLLEESAAAIVIDAGYLGDPLEALANPDVDVVVTFGDMENGDGWNVYVDETNPMLVRRFLRLAQGVLVAMSVSSQEKGESQGTKSQDFKQQIYLINALQGFPFRPAFLYYPAASDTSLSLLPMTIGLILCILPFVLAAPSILRERIAGTLEILLAAPGIGSGSIFASKCLLPVAFTAVELLLMLLLAEWRFDAFVKADIGWLMILLTPAILASALLGLCASMIVKSQSQAIMLTGAYMFCMILFTGFISPLDESSAMIRTLSYIFPLTFVLEPMNSWMFGAPLTASLMDNALALTIQLLIYLGLALAAWHRLLKRI